MSKYHLSELIHSLSKEEIRNFKLYATRIHFGDKDKKLVQLFDRIKKDNMDEFSDDLVVEFFKDKNKNAYYRLKNRLVSDIEYSLLMLNRAKDERLKILNWLQLVRIFSYKSEYEKALYYLQKSEKLSSKLEYYDLLNIVYDEAIDICRRYDKIDPNKYIDKKNRNLEMYKFAQQISSLLATLNYRLKRTNFSGRENEVIPELQKIVERLKLSKEFKESYIVKVQMHDCARDILLQKKEFHALEEYTIEQLKEFEAQKLFTKANYEHKIVMLIWIINASIKNGKLEQALDYTNRLKNDLEDFDNLYHDKYLWLYHQSLVMIYALSGKNQKAIEELERIRNNPKFNQNLSQHIFLYVNLATCYYCAKDLDNALDNLAQILSYDIYKKLSPDWRLSVTLIEIIFRIETEDYDYAQYKLGEAKRVFRKQLKEGGYEREKKFLDILKDLITKIKPLKNVKVNAKIQEFISESEGFELASNEGINYQIWLRSKVEKKEYYELIVGEINKDITTDRLLNMPKKTH